MSDGASREQTIDALAALIGAKIVGPSDRVICGLRGLEDAGPEHLTFIATARHAPRWASSRGGAALVTSGAIPVEPDPAGRTLLFVDDAEQAMIPLLEHFAAPCTRPDPGVHPSAWVHPSATLGEGVRIAAHVSIDAGAVIGDRVVLHAGVRIAPAVIVGSDSLLHANVVVGERCVVGRRVIIHPGAVIGADGFGYRPDKVAGGLRKVPQIGNVEIGDDVEIGAATCVDRAKFGSTTIGRGSKLDNLIQVAHNCRIGQWCVIAANVGLAGSVTIGDGVQIGGAANFVPHVTVGSGARIGAASGVIGDIEAGATVAGTPAVHVPDALRQVAATRRLPEVLRLLTRAGILPRGRGDRSQAERP